VGLPNEVLSSTPVPARFAVGYRLPSSREADYELGPVAIQDVSQGLQVQTWRARLRNDSIYLTAENTPEFKVFTGRGISDIGFTFDQNGRYLIAYVEQEVLKLYWYDTVLQGYTSKILGTGNISPKITLDDKRPRFNLTNDVVLAYVRAGKLYYRQQRDRFDVEYLLLDDVPGRLLHMGMNVQMRLQFLMEAEPRSCISCTLPEGKLWAPQPVDH